MELVVRIVVVYVFLLVVLRVIGKRELGEMSPMELVTLMLIPEIVTDALKDDDHSLIGGVIGICTLLVLVFISSLISYRFKKAEDIIEGKPTLLVNNGKLISENADRERISIDEIYGEMHKQGYSTLSEIRWVILETDGKLAFVPHQRNEHQTGNDEHAV